MRPLRLIAVVSLFAAYSASSWAQERRMHEEWLGSLGVDPGAPIFVLPAQAGPVIDIAQQLTDDRFVQTEVLQGDPATPGRNTIVATIVRNGLAPPATDEDVESEMADSLPGFDMRPVIFPARNVFGIFGYALGAKGPVNCLYAWQALDNADIWITGRRASLFGERHALTMRVRLCLSRLPPTALAALAQRLTRNRLSTLLASNRRGMGYYGVLPVSSTFVSSFSAPTAPLAEARPRQEVMSVAAMLAQPQPEPERPRRFHRIGRAIEGRVTARPPVQAQPLSGMPDVPMPQ